MKNLRLPIVLFVASASVAGCSRDATPDGQTAQQTAASGAAADDEEIPPPVYESALPEDMRSSVDQTFTGDWEEMIKRRLIRVGVTFNRSFYFVDNGTQRGLAYEYLTAPEMEWHE